MKIFIAAMLIINSCAFIFNLCFGLYLSFSPQIKQEKYNGKSRKFRKLILLVPAMNEFSALKRSLPKLLELRNRCQDFIDLKLVFIDDDSNDGTTELLRNWAQHNHINVIHRTKPNAQLGKGPALQDAINQISQTEFSINDTLVGIIDADSSFDHNYLKKVVKVFQNSSYDLVQTRVDIYNTVNNLTIMQNFELSIFNSLSQMARTYWGSALASGNGQFTTLQMAKDVGWSSSLLEDCEFSLKGLLKGYYGTFLNTTSIKQEGITNLSKLIRQRTRWCQGGLQCLKIYGRKILKLQQLSKIARFFILFFLLIPYLSVVIAPSSVISILVLLFYAFYNPLISLSIILGLLLTEYLVNGLMIRKQWRESNTKPPTNHLKIFRIIFSFCFYRWILAFVPYLAIIRELRGETSWTKTKHN